MVKLSAIQMCSQPDVTLNLVNIAKHLTTLSSDSEHIVVLPECCLYFGGKDKEQLNLARQHQQSKFLQAQLADLAKKFNVILVAGSIPILNEDGDKFTNSCCVYSPSGEALGRYDKIHLFDVAVADSEKNYRESAVTQPGESTCVVKHNLANIGLSICYDLRFPQLFQQLRIAGADIITVPSAFTRVTGKAHWQALLQARAIENQVYIIAAAQEGIHSNGRETWGHSMIISPWGEIMAELPKGEGIVSAEYVPARLTEIRQSMPITQHNKFESKLSTYE